MRFIKLPEVILKTAVPESSVYWRISRGEFPRPYKLGVRAVAWREDEIDAWIAAKIEAARAAA